MKISSRPLLQPSHVPVLYFLLFFFFFNDTATTEIYTLSLHDALPILRFPIRGRQSPVDISSKKLPGALRATTRSEEHTSELQSQSNLVCRLLLEKKKELKAGGRGVLQNKPHRSPDMLATPSRRCVRVR